MDINGMLDLFDKKDFFDFVFRNGIYSIDNTGISSPHILKINKNSAERANVKEGLTFIPDENFWFTISFEDALALSESFVFENKSDWRLPTMDELRVIMQNEFCRSDVGKIPTGNGHYIFYWDLFKNLYFSSDLWHKNFIECRTYDNKKDNFETKRKDIRKRFIYGSLFLVR